MADGAPPKDHPLFKEQSLLPETIPDTIVFVGYHKRTGENLRIFTSLDFDTWVDVPIGSVQAHAINTHNDLDPSIFWVDKDAVVTLSSARRSEAQYLKGAIADQELAAGYAQSPRLFFSLPWCALCSGTVRTPTSIKCA